MSETNAQDAQPKENEVAAHIKATFNNQVDVRDYKFHFKTTEDKETGLKVKRPTVELSLPVPSVEGAIAAIEAGGKQLDLLLEAMAAMVVSRAREIVNEKEDVTQDNFPMQELAWETIANLPEAEKRGRGIPKEIWEAFAEDYVAVMPGLTGKTEKQVQAAADIFLDKFNKHRANKNVIRLLKDQLGIYISNSSNAETFMECVAFLNDKADRLMKADDSSILEALGG